MPQKLFIGGLSFSTPTERLRELFNQIEGVESVAIVTDRDSGQSRGFAFVTMASAADATKAISQLNGALLDGRPLRVNEAEERQNNRGGGGGGGGNARGGHRGWLEPLSGWAADGAQVSSPPQSAGPGPGRATPDRRAYRDPR